MSTTSNGSLMSVKMRLLRVLTMAPLIPLIAVGKAAQEAFDWLDGRLDDR